MAGRGAGLGESTVETFCRRDGIVARHIGGETILVPVVDNLADLLRIFVLNPVGECIWQNLESPTSLDDLCRAVVHDRMYRGPSFQRNR